MFSTVVVVLSFILPFNITKTLLPVCLLLEQIIVSAAPAALSYWIPVEVSTDWILSVGRFLILVGVGSAPTIPAIGLNTLVFLPWFTNNVRNLIGQVWWDRLLAMGFSISILVFSVFVQGVAIVLPTIFMWVPYAFILGFTKFKLLLILVSLFWACFAGALLLFLCQVSLIFASIRILASNNIADIGARRFFILMAGVFESIINPWGLISQHGNDTVKAFCRIFLPTAGLALAPYVIVARFTFALMAKPYHKWVHLTTVITASISRLPDVVLARAELDQLTGLDNFIAQYILLFKFIFSGDDDAVDTWLTIAGRWIYPIKLFYFFLYHLTAASNFELADVGSTIARPATLRFRLSMLAVSPLLAMFGSPFYFAVGVFTTCFIFFALFYLGSPITVLTTFVWPLIVALYCQVRPLRTYVASLIDDEADYRAKVLKTPFGKIIKGTYLSVVRFILNLYMLSVKESSDPVFRYRVNNLLYTVDFRDDLPVYEDHLISILSKLVRATPIAYQHFLVALLPIIIVIYAFLRLVFGTTKFAISLIYNYVIDLLSWILLILFIPDQLLWILVGFFEKGKLHFRAAYHNADVDAFSMYKLIKKQLSYFPKGFALFRLSFLSDSELDQFGVRLWPSMDPASRARRLASVRIWSLRILKRFDDLSLPEFIEAQFQPPTVDSIKESYTTLKDMGWPIDQDFIDSIKGPSDDAYLNSWAGVRDHLIATTNYRLGLVRGKVGVPEEMSNFAGLLWSFGRVMGYFHTAFYNSIEAEEISTARYFTGGDSNFQEFSGAESADILDGLWEGVKTQFSFSRLASFDYVFNHWEKKFNMGFGFSAPGRSGVKRQLTRRGAINIVGGRKAFMALWADTFNKFATLVPVAPVFAKLETLKEKKYLQRAVRTVIGSAITHHIATTVFNFMPNHNYDIWGTPMKVGMAFNGVNFGRLWQSVSRHTFVWAGDMTAFDSTVSPAVVKIVRDCRKRGFTSHKDYVRICQLIDIAYDQLLHHPMGFKSTGKIFGKQQGFTTGHSSTSADNSLALVVTYLFAWRRVTGLRCKEFYTYNTLANFGDDHILGYDPVFGWNPVAASKAMEDIGCIMRDEAPTSIHLPGFLTEKKARRAFDLLKPDMSFDDYFDSLKFVENHPLDNKLSFLAKLPLYRSHRVNQELRDAGVNLDYEFATCHDPRRLVGKITGQLFNNTHPKIRRDRLLSYLDLCAHHRDIYEQLLASIRVIDDKYNALWRRDGTLSSLKKPKSYDEIIQKWYNEKSNVKNVTYPDDEAVEESFEDLGLLLSNDGFVDLAVRFLADAPTNFAPRLSLPAWSSWLLTKFSSGLSWPAHFLAQMNGVQFGSPANEGLLASTNYRIISHPDVLRSVPNKTNLTTNIIRHYLFVIITMTLRSSRRTPTFLDLPQLFDNFLSQWYFIIFGRAVNGVTTQNIDFVGIFIIYLLNLLEFEPFLDNFISRTRSWPLPTASMLFASLFFEFRRLLWPVGAIDIQPALAAAAYHLANKGGSILSAPTGVGKSTSLIVSMHKRTGARMVVIQPRNVVVLGVSDFVRKTNPELTVSARTEGGWGTSNDAINYCTPQFFFLDDSLRNPENTIFILDEAHIDEPMYKIAANWMRSEDIAKAYFLVTATPLDHWTESKVFIDARSRFNIHRIDHEVDSMAQYINLLVPSVLESSVYHKVLIFVPSLALCDTLHKRIPFSSVLNSKAKSVDPGSRVIISTNVADAGLTIPDVAVVWSCDLDVFASVSSLKTFDDTLDKEIRQYTKNVAYYRLSPQTVRQRMGRTGRTCDGVFNFVSIKKVVAQKVWTHEDFIDAAGPSVGKIDKYIPGLTETIKDLLPPSGERIGPWWEQIMTKFAEPSDEVGGEIGHFRRITGNPDLNNNETRLDSIETFYLVDDELPSAELVARWIPGRPPPEEVPVGPDQTLVPTGLGGRDWDDELKPIYPTGWRIPPTLIDDNDHEVFRAAMGQFNLDPTLTALLLRDYPNAEALKRPLLLWFQEPFFTNVIPRLRSMGPLHFSKMIQNHLATQALLPTTNVVEPQNPSKGKDASRELPVRDIDGLAKAWQSSIRMARAVIAQSGFSEPTFMQIWYDQPDHFIFNTNLDEIFEHFGTESLSDGMHRLFGGYVQSGQGSR